ncbi:hypothetical protein [Helicobacter marmotae]|uniref:Major outer membrane protein n=1 Tax=Helicobacter marmotae TaxID=152490 RepID=A0A3D8I3T1_9HELI|nr:hypothetical protein [Helicobacter marmotae]RDU59813.1 hypothetical protein CQA63_05195 [Helicobacter marmotae]
MKKQLMLLALSVLTLSAQDELKSWFEGLEFKGFAFARYSGVNGAEGYGDRWQYRFKLDAKSEEINGWNLTAGVYLNQGSSVPKLGSSTHGDVQGDQALSLHNGNFPDRFSIAQLYGSKKFNSDNVKFAFDAGRMNIISTFTDKSTDVGLGARGSLKFKPLELSVAFYDSWATNNFGYAFNAMSTKPITDSAWGLGNNLTMLSLATPKDNKIADMLSFKASVANVIGLFDYLGFVELKADIGKYYVLAQVAAAGVNSTPFYQLSKVNTLPYGNIATWSNTNTFPTYNGLTNTDFAKNRGIYNIQLGAKFGSLGAKLGFLGSFGDGYGVLLTSTGGISTAGKIWSNNINSSSEGFGILGSGGRDGTSIIVGYGAIDFKLTAPLKIGLDISYISGDNNYAYVNVSRAPNMKENAKGIDFFEVAPSLTYALSEKLKFNLFYAQWLGDVTFGKTRAEIRFDF